MAILAYNWRLLFLSESEYFCGDTLVKFEDLASHQILMRNTAPDIVDNLFSLGIEMGVLISILLGNILRREVKFTNIGTSNVSKFLHEFGQYFLQ